LLRAIAWRVSKGGFAMSAAISVITLLVGAGIASYLLFMLVKSIVDERRSSNVRRVWPNFALSITFAILFFATWVAHAVAEWGVYRQERLAHGEATSLGQYIVEFGQSTFENWQSEFLQLFSFVVLSAVLIHRGSAESKDGTDRIESAVRRIERRLEELEASPRSP
jgi:hypothetical protein